jgi:Lar family restriction alleviation protein
MESKLLNCPFCGVRAEESEENGREIDVWCIVCKNSKCGARIYNHGTRQEIRDLWNRRTLMSGVIYGDL